MNCPKCSAAMELVTFEDIEVDRCTGCGGIWFDSRENEKLRDRPGARAIDTGSAAVGRRYNQVKGVHCPRCTTRMVRLVDAQSPHIGYEGCSVCGGAFFDAGEFRDYARHSVFDVIRDLFAGDRG